MEFTDFNCFSANFLTICFLSAILISAVRGIMWYKALRSSKILILQFLL